MGRPRRTMRVGSNIGRGCRITVLCLRQALFVPADVRFLSQLHLRDIVLRARVVPPARSTPVSCTGRSPSGPRTDTSRRQWRRPMTTMAAILRRPRYRLRQEPPRALSIASINSSQSLANRWSRSSKAFRSLNDLSTSGRSPRAGKGALPICTGITRQRWLVKASATSRRTRSSGSSRRRLPSGLVVLAQVGPMSVSKDATIAYVPLDDLPELCARLGSFRHPVKTASGAEAILQIDR